MKRRRFPISGLRFASVARLLIRGRKGTFVVAFSLMVPILLLLGGFGFD